VSAQSSGLWPAYASALGVVAIWSGFIVFSRLGVTGDLTTYDVTALRFLVGGIITIPFSIFYWPRHLALRKVLFLTVCGPGVLYSQSMYFGLKLSPAAYAGVFANGAIPIFTVFLAFIFLGERLTSKAFAGIAVIFAGGWIVAFNGLTPGGGGGGGGTTDGIAYFLAAAFLVAAYINSVRRWKLTPRQTLAIINLPNALVFLPVWYFFLPSSLAAAAWSEIVFQALFQGLGPSFLALVLMTYAVHKLGGTLMAGFAASVPTTAALLAIPVLGENLSLVEWGGVATVTSGLALLLWRR
jgi:drug/metabolite transporter (DMT)-like permease